MATCKIRRDNDGNLLYGEAPNGERSILYDQLRTIYGDPERALIEWARTYTSEFRDWFGDWQAGSVSPSLLSSQGEPRIFDTRTAPHYRRPGGTPHVLMIEPQELTDEERQRIVDEVISPEGQDAGPTASRAPNGVPADGQASTTAPPMTRAEQQAYDNEALDKLVTDMQTLVATIKSRYARQLRNRTAESGRSELDKLEQLQRAMAEAENMEATLLFLKDAQDRIRSAHIKMVEAVQVLRSSSRSELERQRAALQLVQAFQLVKGYEMLQGLRPLSAFRLAGDEASEFDPMRALNDLSALYESMWQMYLREGRPLLAEWLMDSFDPELNEIAARYGKEHLKLTKARLLDQLVEHVDISKSSLWLDPLIGVRDDALQLVAKRVKRQLYKALDKDRLFMNELGPLFEAYAKVAPSSARDRAKQMYEPMWQIGKAFDHLSDEEVHQRLKAFKALAKEKPSEALALYKQVVPEQYRVDGYEEPSAFTGATGKKIAESYASALRTRKESVDRAMYVTPWDVNAWAAKREYFFTQGLPQLMAQYEADARQDPKVIDLQKALDAYEQKVKREFYNQYLVALPNWLELADRQRKSMTLSEFQLWFDDHLYIKAPERRRYYTPEEQQRMIKNMWAEGFNEALIAPRGDLTIPDPQQFPNAKFKALWGEDVASFYEAIDSTREQPMTGDAKKDMYVFLLRAHFDALDRIPNTHWLGWKLPGVRADYLSRIVEGRPAKETLSEWIRRGTTFQLTDTQYGELDLSGGMVRDVPVYYTHSLSPGEVSYDLAQSALLFTQMSHNYESLASIREYVTLMGDVIDNRSVVSTNARGQEMINSIAKKLGRERKLVEVQGGNAAARLREFVNMVYFGQSTERAGVAIPGTDTVIEWNKIADRMASYTTLTGLAFNVMQGTSNLLLGEVFLAQEAVAGQFFSKKQAAKGAARMSKYLATQWAFDHDKLHNKSIEGQLFDKYDPLQGKFQDSFGREVTGGTLQKYFNTNALFVLQHAGELAMQGQMLFNLMEAEQVPLAGGGTISMMDMYIKDEKGRLAVRSDVALSKAEIEALEEKVRNRTHALNKKLHGVYNRFDRSVLQKYWWGRWVMVYRKWIKPGIDRRFMAERLDHELTDISEGYYRTTATILKKLIDHRTELAATWGSLSSFEKQQAMRSLYDVVMLAGLWLLGRALLASSDDDDSWGRKFATYQVIRLRKEMIAYISPQQYMRILQQPSAVFTLVGDVVEVFALATTDPMGRYKQDSGMFEKGDLKMKKHLMDLMPILKSLQRASAPDEALELLDPLSSARYGR